MANTKLSGLKLGPGATTNKNGEAEFFCEQRTPYNGTPGTANWSSGTSYSLGQAIVYGGVSYNSLQNSNLGNQPDTSPLFWSQVDGKDGDIWFQTPAAGFPAGGTDCDVFQKSGNIWASLRGKEIQIALVDGQLVTADAISIPAGIFNYANVEYTVRRGGGHGRKRQGSMKILNDGSSVQYSHDFNEIGSDVNVPFTVSVSGGFVHFEYTSANEGVPIMFGYVLKGWS